MPSERRRADPPESEQNERPRVRVSDLGEFIRFDSCERRFRLSHNKRAAARRLPFFERLFSSLDPVLQQAGNAAEDSWQEELLSDGYRELAPAETVPDEDGAVRPARTPWADFAEVAATLEVSEPAYGREILVEGTIGHFEVAGAIDFVLVEWADDRPRVRLVEGKSSRKDRTYHRIQLVTYLILLRQILAEIPLVIAGHEVAADAVEVAVARIDADSGAPQTLAGLEPLGETEREETDIERLLGADGRMAAIVDAELDGLPYQLNGKCDGCVFNVDCLTESSRQRRLELLGIDPSTASALRAVGLATLDDLAALDLEGEIAASVRREPGFTESLARLRQRAAARLSTLPRGDGDPDNFQVEPLPGGGAGQLPSYEQGGYRLVRIYLAVDYDYTENRIGALTAHVTHSTHELDLRFVGEGESWRPDPTIYERRRIAERDENNRIRFRFEEVREIDPDASLTICSLATSAWTGDFAQDGETETELIQGFFQELIEAINTVTGEDESCRLHFYVWNRNEIARLVEACARADSRLLGHLRELLGARESLEQLIFSSVGEEIDGRYGLGWTGRGLIVVASLSWFGQRFHWKRQIGSEEVDLDRTFVQDLFDFKTRLGLNEDGSWSEDLDHAHQAHRFEIRSRNFDTLPAPYWRAMWGTLPTAHELNNPRVKGALERYAQADETKMRAYLTARVEALRWLEEKVAFKNEEIVKAELEIAELPTFDLGVRDIARAAIDVIRLDGHVKTSGWIAEHLVAVRDRVAAGATLPVRDVERIGDRELRATIDLDDFDADLEVMAANWAPEAFVRLTIRAQDPSRGQTLRQLTGGGVTAVVTGVNWDAGQIGFDVIPSRHSRYIFTSAGLDWIVDAGEYATVDTSPSDFVAGRVEARLQGAGSTPAVSWLDATNPAVPEAPEVNPDAAERVEEVVRELRDPEGNALDERQVQSICEGLSSRVQLLQGPPGTGKTVTTAVSILSRILLRHSRGDVILIGANTHTAVNGLMRRVAGIREQFRDLSASTGQELPPVTLVRIGRDEAGETNADVALVPRGCVREVKRLADDAVLVIGGTTSGLLQLADTLSNAFPTFPELIVDEASMMMFPHFFALATLVDGDGHIMLAGDHRQLAPIMAHNWDAEDRPPIEIYQPHLSAYQSVRRLADDERVTESAVRRSALDLSFRLPESIISLIRRVYAQDQIELRGVGRDTPGGGPSDGPLAERAWGSGGLVLVAHDERRSRKANPVEVEIIRRICDAEAAPAAEEIALITPHRAQRELLRQATGDRVDIVDTVERLQGGERKAIIVSGTASDPAAISAATDFILGLNRSNVAFSRVKERLIVVCAHTLLDHIPGEIEQYDETMLWKAIRAACSQPVTEEEIEETRVRLLRVPAPDRPLNA